MGDAKRRRRWAGGHMANAGDPIQIVDNGADDTFFTVKARGVLAFFDGEDWWGYMPGGLLCIGKESSNFVVYRSEENAGQELSQGEKSMTGGFQ